MKRGINTWKSCSIRSKIIISNALVLGMAVIVIGIFFWSSFYHAMEANAYESSYASTLQVQKSMNSNLKQVENTLYTFFNTRVFREWKNNSIDLHTSLQNGEVTLNSNLLDEVENDISSLLMFNNVWIDKIIHSSYVFIEGVPVQLHLPRSYLADNDRRFQSVYDQLETMDTQTYFFPPTAENDFVYIAKTFYNITCTKKITFISALDPHYLCQSLYNLPENYTASLVGEDGLVYFSTDNALVGNSLPFDKQNLSANEDIPNSYKITVDGNLQLVFLQQLDDSEFQIIISTPASTFFQNLFESIIGYIIIILMVLIVFTILSIFLSSVFTRFFTNITGALNRIRKKDYEVTMPSYQEKDLDMISTTFNSMTAEIKNLIQTVFQEKLLLKEANIKQLQSQMNPHFLLNTLTTVSTMALLHQDEELYQMISALTEIIDGGLANSTAATSFVKVSQELKYINCYLYLQQIRFQNKLQYHIQVENDDLMELYIPRLSVEPLVENAIVHGVEESIESGRVEVTISRVDNTLLITILDNGKGFDVEAVLREHRTSSIKGHNISINNTNQRLKMIFGDSYGVSFESEPGKTIASIRIPVLEEPYFSEELS